MSSNSSLWSDAIYRLTRNKAAMIGGGILVALITCALLAPWIAPYSYSYQDLDLGASPPSAEHLLGTDILGRDLLSRILYGARVSLLVGFVATGVALVIGVSWGIIAGFFGGRVDSIMMRIVDILYGLQKRYGQNDRRKRGNISCFRSQSRFTIVKTIQNCIFTGTPLFICIYRCSV